MKKTINLFIFLIFILALVAGCKTTDKNDDKKSTTTTTTTTIEVKTETTTSTTSTTTTIVDSSIDKRLVFSIDENTSKEDMKKHMHDLFTSIEERIAKGDFEGWYKSLTKSYQNYISDPKILQKMSNDSDFLYNRSIVLKSAKDYFEYVVIQAREGRQLVFSDYQYIDKQHVKVFCVLEGLGKFTYNFTYEGNFWKLDR